MKNQEIENIKLLRRALEIADEVNSKLDYCHQQHLKAVEQAQKAA